jgi:heme exporter protein C
LWFIFAGYFLLRKGISDWTKRAQYSAVIGIIGFLDIPVVRLATKWWRSVHPRLKSEGGGLDPLMLKIMIFSMITFLIFTVFLFMYRYRIAKAEENLIILTKRLED